MAGDSVDAMLEQLISNWSGWEASDWYIDVHARAIVRNAPGLNLMPGEWIAVDTLRKALTPEQWNKLPSMLSDCMIRLKTERELQDRTARDRPRAERERKAREVQERQTTERDRRLAEQREIERADREAAEQDRRLNAARTRMRGILESDFLSSDGAFRADPDCEVLGLANLERLKIDFVREWVSKELNYSIDDEQATAVATFGGDLQVTARAGSGKTRTLVTRAIFLMKHCHVPGHAILILVFNRKAAEEIRTRLTEVLVGPLPHVMTFHALAYALVNPDETLVYDDVGTDSLAQSRVVQSVIDEHLQDPSYGGLIKQVMLEHFRSDWEAIAEGGFDLTISESLERRRALPRESLKGDYLKSYGEKLIANTLFENDISYRYERNFKWGGRNYRPDFTISTGADAGIVIEYFGLKGDPDYDNESRDKREFWALKYGWTLLEYSPQHIAVGPETFAANLLGTLAELGVTGQPLSEEDIWQLVRERHIDSFTTTIGDFVSRCRKRDLNQDGLADLIAAHQPLTGSEAGFLQVGRSVYASYLERLSRTNQEDFDGLGWRAVHSLNGGETRFAGTRERPQGDLSRIRYALIDEFQDFTRMFMELVNGIRRVSPGAEFFCVGDDWQAINAFAGSERCFFEKFDRYFSRTRSVEISTNYRSPVDIVNVGNAVMAREGTPARAHRPDRGTIRSCDLAAFQASAAESDRHGGDEITPAALRLIRYCLDNGSDVVLLSRLNSIRWLVNYDEQRRREPGRLERFLSHLLGYLPDADHHRVSISTAHRYKGLEKRAVIILDAVEGSYPLIHPSWIFLRVFGDNIRQIESDERRLFYVAVTRSTDTVFLITETGRISPYVGDIQKQITLQQMPWSALVPVPSLGSPTLEVRVFNAYEVKDDLKNQGFTFVGADKYWRKSTYAESFSLQTTVGHAWCRSPVRVEVVAENGVIVHRHLAT